VGTLAAGKQADLILVDGKPDEDIKQLRQIDLVFRDGIAYDSKKIVESLKGKVGR
jgi:imidazolonepropionase-like amidohydrolase